MSVLSDIGGAAGGPALSEAQRSKYEEEIKVLKNQLM